MTSADFLAVCDRADDAARIVYTSTLIHGDDPGDTEPAMARDPYPFPMSEDQDAYSVLYRCQRVAAGWAPRTSESRFQAVNEYVAARDAELAEIRRRQGWDA
jgi:hypothetical protein